MRHPQFSVLDYIGRITNELIQPLQFRHTLLVAAQPFLSELLFDSNASIDYSQHANLPFKVQQRFIHTPALTPSLWTLTLMLSQV